MNSFVVTIHNIVNISMIQYIVEIIWICYSTTWCCFLFNVDMFLYNVIKTSYGTFSCKIIFNLLQWKFRIKRKKYLFFLIICIVNNINIITIIIIIIIITIIIMKSEVWPWIKTSYLILYTIELIYFIIINKIIL